MTGAVSTSKESRPVDWSKVFLVGAGAYAWQVHNFWIGLGVLIGVGAAIIVCNLAIMYRKGDERTLKWMRWIRWTVIGAAWIGIALSGTEACELVNGILECHPLFG